MMGTVEFLDNVTKLKADDETTGNKVGTVVGLFESGAAKIQFDGEAEPSEKEFPYLKSYVPTIGDEVFLQRHAGDYIIIDAILNNGKSPHVIDLNNIKGDLKVDGKISSSKDIEVGQSLIVTEDIMLRGNILIDGTVTNEGLTDLIGKKVSSNMSNDNNGNMNIDYMYVDPDTSLLHVRRKNGAWTSYRP